MVGSNWDADKVFSGESTAITSSPQVSPPMPKIPWTMLQEVSTVTPCAGWRSTTAPSTYASRSSGRGGSRSSICPVIVETDSTFPRMGERTSVLNHLMNGLFSAMTSSWLTASPSFLTR